MALRYLIFGILIIVEAITFTSANVRRPKSLRSPVTSTEIQFQIVTKTIPSSCVLVEPTLPACRTIRYLHFPALFGSSSEETVNVTKEQRTEPDTQPSDLSWGEYFGIYAPTVTVTRTRFHTTTVQDPNTVITFSVMGCRPKSLPRDMSPCPGASSVSEEVEPTKYVYAETVISPSSVLPVTATVLPKLDQEDLDRHINPYVANNDVHTVSSFIDETASDTSSAQPTEELQ